MMIIERDLWFCVDCTIGSVNGDYSGIESERRAAHVRDSVAAVPNASANFYSEKEDGIREFSSCGCDCCGTWLAGTMHRFAILGERLADYEACGECGYDHSYEPQEAHDAHESEEA